MLVCSRHWVERRAGQRRNESNFFHPLAMPSLIYSTSVSVGFLRLRRGHIYTRKRVYYFYFYFFPLSNPPVFFLSTRRLSDRIFYRLGSAHSDNLLFLHPLTRTYWCSSYIRGNRLYYNIYVFILYADQGDFLFQHRSICLKYLTMSVYYRP